MKLSAKWRLNAALVEIPVAEWSPQATIHFINSLPGDLAHDKLAELDERATVDSLTGFSSDTYASSSEWSHNWFRQRGEPSAA